MIKYLLVCLAVLINLFGLAMGDTIIVSQNESIQAAILQASRGDIILVNAGNYYENLDINKSLTLQGIGMPVIDGGGEGRVITLSSGNTILEGFIIRNSSRSLERDAGIIITSNNNSLKSNIIENCRSGIAIYNFNNNTIEANNLSDNEASIRILAGIGNKIVSNKAYNNNFGISLQNATYNIIKSNNVFHNSYGISLDVSNNNSLKENSVSLSNKYGIILKHSDKNTFQNDNASSNKWHGIRIEDSNYNIFTNSTASYNKDDGFNIVRGYGNEIEGSFLKNNIYGIYLRDCSGNTVSDDNIEFSQKSGIYCTNSTNSSFTGNDVSNNEGGGIELVKGFGNSINNNNANNNTYGISISNSRDNIIMDNKVNHNREAGIYLNKFKNGTVIGNNAFSNRIGFTISESGYNSIHGNNVSYNKLSGISVEFGLNNTIASNMAHDNLGGIILLYSRNNSIENNTVNNGSTAIALQNSSNNTISGNNASYNNISIYLNRSISNLIEENEFLKNSVGVALNHSDINVSNNSYILNEYNILTNDNESISKYPIWKQIVIAERIEQFLRRYQAAEEKIGKKTTAGTETSIIRPKTPKTSGSSNMLPVSIDSNPGGAEIWIDGKSGGKMTPDKIYLKRKGNHDIELFLCGYEPKKETHYISSPTFIKMDLEPIQSEKNFSTLCFSVNSTPQGASIWIDKNFTGKYTPNEIYFDTPGNHTYYLFLSGYQIYGGDINITKSTSINAKLITKIINADALAATESKSQNERSNIPGFLLWQPLLAIFLAYYLLFIDRIR